MKNKNDWREIERIMAEEAKAQGFHVSKDLSGRFVVYGFGVDDELDLERLAQQIALSTATP